LLSSAEKREKYGRRAEPAVRRQGTKTRPTEDEKKRESRVNGKSVGFRFFCRLFYRGKSKRGKNMDMNDCVSQRKPRDVPVVLLAFTPKGVEIEQVRRKDGLQERPTENTHQGIRLQK